MTGHLSVTHLMFPVNTKQHTRDNFHKCFGFHGCQILTNGYDFLLDHPNDSPYVPLSHITNNFTLFCTDHNKTPRVIFSKFENLKIQLMEMNKGQRWRINTRYL